MKAKNTSLTILIDDMLKKKAKVNALIEEDCKRGVINGKKMD